MAGIPALSPFSKNKYRLLLDRVRAHLTMLKAVKQFDENAVLLRSTADKYARKAKRNLKTLSKRIVQRQIKHQKKLHAALNESLKYLKKFVLFSQQKKKRRSALSLYLKSLLELKESRFV